MGDSTKGTWEILQEKDTWCLVGIPHPSGQITSKIDKDVLRILPANLTVCFVRARHHSRPYVRLSGTRTPHLHRWIVLGQYNLKGVEVDHINGDSLDNRRENLRRCTKSENMANRSLQKNNTLGVRGVWVYQTRGGNKYRAEIKVNGKKISLGNFDTIEEAATVRDAASIHYFGEFAQLNYPQSKRECNE